MYWKQQIENRLNISMEKTIFILLFAAILTHKANAQIISFNAGFDENRLTMRVKQLDEFIARFNYENDIWGNPVANKQDMEMRKKYVYSLFNEELFDNSSDDFPELYKDFINTVSDVRQPAYIRFTDTDWLAQADCKAIYNGKQIDLTLFLCIEHIEGDRYKWVIIGVKDSLFALNPDKRNPGMLISPTDNELRFMSLPDLSGKNRQNITNYAPKEYRVDKLTVFNTLIYTGQLHIEYVKAVSYLFFQIPDYVFYVAHFERNIYNVGWLISKVEKKNEDEKAIYWNESINK